MSEDNDRSERAKTVLSAPVDEVCLMEDRGRVIRRGAVSLAAGRHTVLVHGVSPVAVDKTLVVATQDGSSVVKVIDARVVREVVADTDDARQSSEVGRLEEARRLLETDMQRRSTELDRTNQRFRGMTRTLELGLRELVSDASWDRSAAPEDFSELDTLRREAMVLLDSRVPLEEAQQDARDEIHRIDIQLHALQTPSESRRAYIEIDVEAKAACEAKLQLEYSVPGACWRPAHRAELIDREGSAVVRFETDACVWQNTGEDWDDVQLILSTERASLGVEPPELRSDILSVQRKSQTVEIEARDQAVDELGPGGGGSSSAPKLPGIDDGGTALNLRAPQRKPRRH